MNVCVRSWRLCAFDVVDNVLEKCCTLAQIEKAEQITFNQTQAKTTGFYLWFPARRQTLLSAAKSPVSRNLLLVPVTSQF